MDQEWKKEWAEERANARAAAKARARAERWAAPARSRVVHPTRGTVVVPHLSNLAALMNAAEVWGCSFADLGDARVWAAEPGDVAVERPYIAEVDTSCVSVSTSCPSC